MILISHRGNTNGKNIEKENSPDYIINTLNLGYDVEIDIWYINNEWFFGHDEPTYKIDLETFKKYVNNIWFHCKNLQALEKIRNFENSCYFWHENDKYTLTSNNLIWTYPNMELSELSICVLPELHKYSYTELISCYGICSDFIKNYKNINYL